MTFQKKDMLYNSYAWTSYSKDSPKISGKADTTRFSRHEGAEVLYMVNLIMEESGLKSKQGGQKIERFIKLDLPYNIIKQSEVRSWILKHLKH